MDLHYQMVISGYSPDLDLDDRAKDCNEQLMSACVGKTGDCISEKVWSLSDKCVKASDQLYDRYARKVKHSDFYADLDILDIAIGSAIYNLHKACGGRWPGSGWTTPFTTLTNVIKVKSNIGDGNEG